jgi:hypothetical protein
MVAKDACNSVLDLHGPILDRYAVLTFLDSLKIVGQHLGQVVCLAHVCCGFDGDGLGSLAIDIVLDKFVGSHNLASYRHSFGIIERINIRVASHILSHQQLLKRIIRKHGDEEVIQFVILGFADEVGIEKLFNDSTGKLAAGYQVFGKLLFEEKIEKFNAFQTSLNHLIEQG